MKRSGRISPTSKTRKKELASRREIKKRVFARDGGCLLSPWLHLNPNGTEWGPCLGDLTPHHVKKASQGGEYTEENLKTLCAHHNSMIEDYPKAAQRIGLVKLSWEE